MRHHGVVFVGVIHDIAFECGDIRQVLEEEVPMLEGTKPGFDERIANGRQLLLIWRSEHIRSVSPTNSTHYWAARLR